MRKSLYFLSAAAAVVFLETGCANTEAKFGRGVRNVTEFTRLGEIRRSMEQTALLDGPDVAYSAGFVSGFNKSLVRTGVGIYEIVTAPLPSYDPVFTDYMTENPVYPDSYRPRRITDSMWDFDAALGFAGGDIAPFVPGSRFRIFDY
jgi:putative exosortase-associated protein (TIGR04073 family)